jgi:hypothetical protein
MNKKLMAVAFVLLIASIASIGYSLKVIATKRSGVRLSKSGVLATELEVYPAGTTTLALRLRNDGRYPIGGWSIFSLDKWDGGDWVYAATLSDYKQAGSTSHSTTFNLKPSEEMLFSFDLRVSHDDGGSWAISETSVGEYRVGAVYSVEYEITGRTLNISFPAYGYFTCIYTSE